MSYLLPRRRSLPPFAIALLLAAGAVLGLGAAFLVFAPRIVSISPREGSRTGSYAAIEVLFSVPMDPDCAAAHFSVEPAAQGTLTVEGAVLRFEPREPWPAGTAVTASVRSGACSARGLPLAAGRSWGFSPSLVRIAYIPIGGSGNTLMGVSPDGGEPEPLALSAAPLQNFDISPRGGFAVFSTAVSGSPGGLWITRLDGGPAEMLLDCGEDSCRDPVVSPDESLVAFVRGDPGSGSPGPARIEVLNVDGGEIRPVSPSENTAVDPSWSPQGWLSYYDQTRLLTVVDDLAGGQTVMPNDAGTGWSWLPDGSALILPELLLEGEIGGEVEGASPSIFSRLVRVDLKTNQRTNLSGTDRIEDSSPAVSPDGTRLAFSRNFFDDRWTPGRQLWILDLAGGTARQISQAPEYSHSAIRWSPDGSRLVYMLFHETVPSDPPEIWSVNADGTDPQLLAVGGFLPQWLP